MYFSHGTLDNGVTTQTIQSASIQFSLQPLGLVEKNTKMIGFTLNAYISFMHVLYMSNTVQHGEGGRLSSGGRAVVNC